MSVDAARSALMARIGARNTKPELRVRRALHRAGLRYRLHPKNVPGRPDLAFSSRRIAVFVHGCFWHRHCGCSRTRTPKSRIDFWEAKFAQNIARDVRVHERLVAIGWTAIIVWECQTLDGEVLEALATEILKRPTKARR